MLRVDPTLNHIPARKEHVVSLYESINQPLVNIPNQGTAPTGAYLMGTRNEHGYYTVFVYLHQPETRAVIIYVSEPRSLTAEQFNIEESEAVRFVESMGFMVDGIPFRQLPAADQEATIARIPIFRPPQPSVDLFYDLGGEVAKQLQAGDPVFGGVGPGGAEVFRRAGLGGPGQGSGPVPPAGSAAPHSPGLLGFQTSTQAHGMGAFGPKTPMPLAASHVGLPSVAGPPTPLPGPGPLPGLGSGLTLPSSPPGTMPSIPPGATSIVPGQPTSPGFGGTTSSMDAPEALERLGRLLAAFSFLLCASVASAASCKGTGAGTGTDTGEANPFQNQLDIGEQQLAEQRWADAIATFSQVLEEEPKDRDALRGTGLAYMGLGRLEQAEPYYRRAIEADPKWSEPKNELAGILIRTRRCGEAEELLRVVGEDIFYATPEFAEHNLALALDCQGRQGEAVTRLENLLTKRPQFCLGYLTLSKLSAQAKQHELTVKACEDFDAHCARHEKIREQVSPENNAICYYRAGMAYGQLGDVESARAAFGRCLGAVAGGAIGGECRRALELLPP